MRNSWKMPRCLGGVVYYSKRINIMEEEIKAIYQGLNDKYKKLALTKKELSQELGISVSSINYYLSKGINLPRYKKFDGKGMGGYGGKVLFPLTEIAKYLIRTNKIA